MSDEEGLVQSESARLASTRQSRERDSSTSPSDARSYYGRPIVKEPAWKPEVPWYLFFGGMAGAASNLVLAARLRGNDELARAALYTAMAGLGASPPLLIKDLGRPERFYNMLRVFKLTSPMSVGTWIVTANASAVFAVGACELLGILPRVKRAAEWTGAFFGPLLSTYTAVLLADTSIPVWHEGRRHLPFVFAGSSVASAGAVTAAVAAPEYAGPARRLALFGAAVEIGAHRIMERRLGLVGEVYREGRAGRYGRLSDLCTGAGAATIAVAGRRRVGAVAGAGLVAAGSVLQRWSVFRAGFQSAQDPKYTVIPQRRRLETRRGQATTRSGSE